MRVVYLSDTELGKEMYDFLKKCDCEVVFADLENTRFSNIRLPEYDLGISFLYSWKVPESELQSPYRWVNFHPAPLPEYGGRNLAYHAIMDGAAEFGATVHYMDKGFDTGEIIRVERFKINPRDTAGDLVAWSRYFLRLMFIAWIPNILLGKIPSTPQNGTTRYFKREPISDLVELTDGQQRLVRALTVHPTYHAKATVGGRTYKIIPEDKL